MKLRPALLALGLAAGAVGPSVCVAQATSPARSAWQAQYDQALTQYAARDLAAAEASARRALATARQGQGPAQPFVASSLNALALIRQAQGQPAEAVELLGQALSLSEAALGAHTNTASLAFNLAQALEQLARPREALPHYERSLAIADRLGGDPAVAGLRQQALVALGRLHAQLGHAAEAEAHTRRLLAQGTDVPALVRADALVRQAVALEAQGRIEPACEALEQALALTEAEWGPDHAAVAHALGLLAALHARQGRHEAAQPLHLRALAIRDALDPQDPRIAEHLNELALWHLEKKDYGSAQDLLQRALVLVERHRGAQSLEAARLVGTQALLQGEWGDEARAQALHQRALAIYQQHGEAPEALLGQAQALNHLAGFVYRKRRFKEAEPMFLRSLVLVEQAVGTQDERLLPVLDNLQALYRSQRQEDAARPYARRATALREAAAGSPSPLEAGR